MSYPPSVSYYMKRLMAHTTNVYKIEPNNATTASANNLVRFDLPSNTLLDLSSIQFWFNAKVSGGTQGRLPNKISSLIERYTVECGGITIYQGNQSYNVVKHVKDALMCPLDVANTSKRVVTHEDIPRATSYVDGTTLNGPEAPSADLGATQFMIGGGDLLGFFEAKPTILDTSLLPTISITFTLAGNNVLTDSDSTTNFTTAGSGSAASYILNNMRLHTTVYGIQDGSYDMMVESLINAQGFLEIPFKQYHTFVDGSHSGTTRFSLGAQSLDMLYAVFRADTYATQGAPVMVTGYNGSYEDSTHQGEKYLSKYFKFEAPSAFTGAQFQVNGTLYPQFVPTADEWYGITMDAVKARANQITSLESWKNDYFILAQRFNHPGADAMRLSSGLDTRAMNLSGFLNTTGGVNSVPVVIIAETTSILRVGKQLQIEVIN